MFKWTESWSPQNRSRDRLGYQQVRPSLSGWGHLLFRKHCGRASGRALRFPSHSAILDVAKTFRVFTVTSETFDLDSLLNTPLTYLKYFKRRGATEPLYAVNLTLQGGSFWQ
eukprot:3258681-Pyramimonas_sp.AAC.1